MKYLVEMRVEAPTVDEAADVVAQLLTAADADPKIVTDIVTKGGGFHPAVGFQEAP